MALHTNLRGQWDVNSRGRDDDTFREWVNGVTEALSGTTALDESGAFDGINFNGPSGYCRAALPAGLSPTFADSDYTIAVRCKLDTTNPGWQGVFGAFASGSNAIRVGLLTENANGDALGGHVSAGTSVYLDGATQIDDGAEHVVVQRRVGNVFSLWVDGAKINEQTVAAGTIGAVNRISFGVNDDQTPEWLFDGTIKWAAIWDNDLSDADVGLLDDAENPFVMTVTPAEPYAGQLVTFNHVLASAPLSANCSYRGVALTLEAGATRLQSTAIWPPETAFRFGGAHAGTRNGVDHSLVIGNAAENVSRLVKTVSQQPGGFGVKDSGTSPHNLGTWNGGLIALATSDEIEMRVVTGTAGLNPSVPEYTPLSELVEIDIKFFDISQASWSGVTRLTYSEGLGLTAADTTLVPGQVVRLTLTGGVFAGAITAAAIVFGSTVIPISWAVVDADETDVTIPALSTFTAGGSAEDLNMYANFAIRLTAGAEIAETPSTNQIVAPGSSVYGLAGAPPWSYPNTSAQQGDFVCMVQQSGASTKTYANFGIEWDEKGVVWVLCFNQASQKWLTRREVAHNIAKAMATTLKEVTRVYVMSSSRKKVVNVYSMSGGVRKKLW